ncbi:MAG: outer membrane protein assembly factor BamA [Betaproteobacteria bacterium]|jgi:outer membrane protein insertion porin family|nr:outer membrane protein assembly factor BamA [Betaproteobacteria bacterium]
MNFCNSSFIQKLVRSLFLVLVLAQSAWAVEPFTVSDIRVEGLQRVEPGTIFATLPFRVGDSYNDEKGTQSIRALFNLGLFKDIRIEVNGTAVLVVIEERPTIASVDFVGAKEFDATTLRKALRDIGLAEGRAFDKSLADKAEQELKRQYINRSLYGAEVVTTITPIDRNRVNLSFNVIEGDVSKIKSLRIIGNKYFSESELLDQLDLSTPNWLSWYTKTDRYSQSKLNADIETLRSYYLTRGFLEFNIDSTQVSISSNKQDIAITINITEGQKYVVSDIKLEGYYLGREDEFKSLITIKPGSQYNINDVTQTSKAFVEYFGNFGFAFARVDPITQIDRERNLVSIVLRADPSRRAYVRRINITGNSKTRDEIVRREFRQMESSWYDGEKIRLSRDRIDRLGYFKDVNIETQEVPGSADLIDINLSLVEKPTGALTLGAGFSSVEKIIFNFGITQDNFLGSGNYLGFNVNLSKFNQIFVLSATDPYFTVGGISRTYDLYHRESKPYNAELGNFRLATSGTGIRFGLPYSEKDRVFVGAGLEQTTIYKGNNIPSAYIDYCNSFGCKSNTLPLTLGWANDSRDSALAPTKGRYARLSGEMGVAGDIHYLKTSAQMQNYMPLSKKYTLAFNAEFGYGEGLKGQPFPVFKNFYSGGLGSVRGFTQGSMGPRDVTGLAIGGTKKILLNTEFQLPFPGAGNDRTLRLFGFYDVGNVFGADQPMLVKELRTSTGIGLNWVSPMGPLRIGFARPVTKHSGDRIEKFQLQIGSTF